LDSGSERDHERHTVVVIGTARNPERLQSAGSELGACRIAAFDASDPAWLERFPLDLRLQSTM